MVGIEGDVPAIQKYVHNKKLKCLQNILVQRSRFLKYSLCKKKKKKRYAKTVQQPAQF